MKQTLFLSTLLFFISTSIFAQRTINETINLDGVTAIEIEAQYATASVKTWDKNTVLVEGSVNIFDNEYNDDFKWEYKKVGNTLQITSSVDMPKRGYTGDWYSSDSKDDCCKKNQMSINLGITIPKNMALKMRSTYGGIVLDDIQAPLDIVDTYGGIDATFSRLPQGELRLESTYSHVDISIPKATKASFTFKTPYGEVLTDMPLEVKSKDTYSKSTITAHLNGGGTAFYAEAGYNTIYLRELK